MEWTEIVAIALSLLFAGLLIVALRRKVISQSDITNLSGLIDAAYDFLKGLNVDSATVAQFAEYARSAVRAVEQLVKTGQIEKDNKVRVDAASEMVEQLAIADGIGEGVVADNEKIIRLLIEAEVNEMQKNRLPDVLPAIEKTE